MKLRSEFPVPAAPEDVFPLFFDPDTMRRCIPGCEELEKIDENTYRGRLINEIAHVRFSAPFSAAIKSVTDADVKIVEAVLSGEDRKLGSSIKIDARLLIRRDGEGSLVSYEMDMALWGKLGRLGEPIVRRRSQEVERDFAGKLAEVFRPEAQAPAEPTNRRTVRSADRPTLVAVPDAPVAYPTVLRVAVVAALLALVAAVIAGARRSR